MTYMSDIVERLQSFDDSALMRDAVAEIERLRNSIRQVDEVLIVCGVGPREDGDYRKALHDLISWEIAVHDDPQVSEVAASRQKELGALRALLKELEWSAKDDDKNCPMGPICPVCRGFRQTGNDSWLGTIGHRKDCRLAAALKGKP